MIKKSLSLSFLFLLSFTAFSQSLSICSWNLKNLGQSKTDADIEQIAHYTQHFDVLAIQEIVTSPPGAQAVARLVEALNRTGAHWDYALSDPTISAPYRAERYAYLWKTSRVKKVGRAWLDKHYEQEIEREPYFIRMEFQGKQFTLVNFHAVPKKMQPETEIKFFKSFPALYPADNLIFCGDFNLPQSHSVFNPLKKLGFLPALENQKTTLRQKCLAGDCLASAYDNLFYDAAKVELSRSGILPFYQDYEHVRLARLLSDHVPIFLEFNLL